MRELAGGESPICPVGMAVATFGNHLVPERFKSRKSRSESAEILRVELVVLEGFFERIEFGLLKALRNKR